MPSAADTPRQDKARMKVYERYRTLLARPELTDQEITQMRLHLIRLAETICEHVWGKQFH